MSGEPLEWSLGHKGWQAPESMFLLHLDVADASPGTTAILPPRGALPYATTSPSCPANTTPAWYTHHTLGQCSLRLQPFCRGDTGATHLERSRPLASTPNDLPGRTQLRALRPPRPSPLCSRPRARVRPGNSTWSTSASAELPGGLWHRGPWDCPTLHPLQLRPSH